MDDDHTCQIPKLIHITGSLYSDQGTLEFGIGIPSSDSFRKTYLYSVQFLIHQNKNRLIACHPLHTLCVYRAWIGTKYFPPAWAICDFGPMVKHAVELAVKLKPQGLRSEQPAEWQDRWRSRQSAFHFCPADISDFEQLCVSWYGPTCRSCLTGTKHLHQSPNWPQRPLVLWASSLRTHCRLSRASMWTLTHLRDSEKGVWGTVAACCLQ